MAQDQALHLTHAHIVVVVERLDQIKDFLLFNKHVLSVMVMEKKLQTLVAIVTVKEKHRHQKK